MRPRFLSSSLLVLLIAGCSGTSRPVGLAERAAPPPVAVRPMPVPPSSAAPNLRLPERLADGSYATPNRDLSDAATIWHVRSALNVAVLACGDPGAAPLYNQMLKAQRATFKAAHAGITADYRGGNLDTAMTRVYNYFSQPPAQRDFCPVATALLAQAVAVAPSEFRGFARMALPQLDAPFVAFYRAYDSYRADLASWRAGSVPPQIAYDAAQFLRDDNVTGGGQVKILATR